MFAAATSWICCWANLEAKAMTESDWENCDDPEQMLLFLGGSGMVAERKARLFAVACCRRPWDWMTDERSRNAILVTERWAEGQASPPEVEAARHLAWDVVLDDANCEVCAGAWNAIWWDAAWEAAARCADAAAREAAW